MFLRIILLMVILIISIVWVDLLNPGTVKLVLPGDNIVEPSKMAVMLGSAAFGALVVFIGLSNLGDLLFVGTGCDRLHADLGAIKQGGGISSKKGKEPPARFFGELAR